MIRNLPRQYREDSWILELNKAIGGQLAEQRKQADSIPDQMSLDTVSWNLAAEERVAGIVPAPGASQEDRRSALKAKWRSGGKVSIETIQTVADAWKNGETSVEFSDGRFVVRFKGAFGVPEDMAGLKKAIGLTIPCHLPVDYLLRFILLRDVHEIMTLDELQTQTLDRFAFGGTT